MNFIWNRTMLRAILISFSLISSMLISFNASACDDKACESAYISATQEYVANGKRRAEAYRIEREAYSKNRERRDYALYVHMHLMIFGDPANKISSSEEMEVL